MKIVITGSRGFVGSALIKLLPQHEIIEWDTKIGKDIGYFQLERGTDFVVHLAGLIDIRDSINHPESYWTTNVEYSKKIFELCNYERVGLVYASSAAAKVWHLSPYGVTKKICEELSYPGQVGLRFETIFGEGASPFSLYGRIKNKTLQYKTDHIRDFVHVDDIAECLNMFINMRQSVYNLKSVYEIGTGNEHKVSDVVDHFKLDVPLKITDNSYEVDRSIADITEINKLGWTAKRSIYE